MKHLAYYEIIETTRPPLVDLDLELVHASFRLCIHMISRGLLEWWGSFEKDIEKELALLYSFHLDTFSTARR